MGDEVQTMLEFARGLGLTQAQLAKRIGESQQVLNNWKRRGAIPGRKLAKVARALGVTVEEILTDKRPGTAAGVKEAPGSYDLDTVRMAREIKSLPPQDRALFQGLLRRLLNAPPGTGR